ncbi:hypothetical protein C922_05700 [Plasmodium inui San Antonio 1]|uniref:Uncharacterized protein n=1 Tax=Plasmodium inui San Antonio 1 TaxID=1237626 RepID=W7AF61_9APIC|nr:hypothetical protein C922_05700 [Plasmodium inui San Antonio 1]EUD63921.1 hypothetical protein C922_05700 [Plasmodium inui San Antonio 1]
MKEGVERWPGLAKWLNEEILQPISSGWEKDFSPDVQTCVRHSTETPLPWGKLLHIIINQVNTDLIADSPKTDQNLLWGKGEWYNILKQNDSLSKPWDKSEVGKGLLLTIVCILTGLTSSGEDERDKYPGRAQLCDQIDTALIVDENQWRRWLSSEGSLSTEQKEECKEEGTPRRCKSASMSLVLTVYRSMASLCEKCGPYSFARWVQKGSEGGVGQGTPYCEVKGRVIECTKSTTRHWKVGDLRMVPLKKEGVTAGTSEVALKQKRAGSGQDPPKPSQQSLQPPHTGSEITEEKPNPSISQGGVRTTLPVNGSMTNSAGTRNGLASLVDQRTTKDPNVPSRTSSMSSSILVRNGSTMSQEDEPHHNKQLELKPSTVTSGSDTSGTTKEQSDPPESTTEEDTGIPPKIGGMVGGVLGVILLGVASVYGIFRICRGKGRRKTGKGRINISILPVPA